MKIKSFALIACVASSISLTASKGFSSGCGLVLLGSNADQVNSLSKPSIKEKAWATLPEGTRTFVAKRIPRFSEVEAELLQNELNDLMPAEAVQFMAYNPQSSHTYLVEELGTLGLKKIADKNKSSFESEHTSNSLEERKNLTAEWLGRLNKAEKKLEQLISMGHVEGKHRAHFEFSLGLIHAFSYGFRNAVKTQDEYNRTRERTPIRIASLRKATDLISSAQSYLSGWELTVSQFILGKHAVNAAAEHSNLGVYSMQWEPKAPAAEALEYTKLAQDQFDLVLQSLKKELNPEQSSPHTQLLHEVTEQQRRLKDLTQNILNYKDRRPILIDSISDEELSSSRQQFINFLLGSDPNWLINELHNNKRYNLFYRQVNNLRWAHQHHYNQTDKASPQKAHMALWTLESGLRSGDFTLEFEAIINHLIINAGFHELSSIGAERINGNSDN